MRKFLISALTLFAACISLQAQQRQWSDGPLQWSDFKGNPAVKTTASYFKGILKISTAVEQEGKSKFETDVKYLTSAIAVMDEKASYADSIVQTSQMLRYHQLQFDMLEVVRRRLQADLNNGMAGIEADNRVEYYQRIYDEQVSDLARMTANGSNDNRLQDYEYMTRKQLDEYMLPSVPQVHPGRWHAGWFVGTGALIPTGEIADLFGYAWLFNIGLSGGYQRWSLKADISYGQPDVKSITQNPLNTPVKDGNRYQSVDDFAKLLSGSISLGYRVIDAKHFALTPHIGGGWTNYAWNYGEYRQDTSITETEVWVIDSETAKDSFHNFNVMAGIDFDWRFHTTVSDKSSFMSGKREQYTSAIRITPYVMYQKYNALIPAISGIQIGINLSYSGFIRALKID